jgi:protein-tyrosine phosphatase
MIDSAGTIDWHAGNPPDWRSISHAAKRGYDLTPLRARPVIPADFGRFDWFLAMDRSIQHALEAMRPADWPGHVGLFLDFAPHLRQIEVPDPYDGGADGFETVLDLIEAGSQSLLAHLVRPDGGARDAGARVSQ